MHNGANGGDDAVPIWQAGREALERRPLGANVACDVGIVGAGIFGLTTAYLLQRAGRATVLVDDGPVAGGQTARTTAHLSTAIDGRYVDVERTHGKEAARLAAESHAAAIQTIERIVREERISCELHALDGYLFAATDAADDVRWLHDEHDAAARAGLEVELLPRFPLAGFASGPCVRFAGQGRLHPLLYLQGLAEAYERAGGRIFTGTHVQSVQGGRAARIVAAGGPVIECAAAVVATNSPINDRFVTHAKQAPYMTYVIGAPLPRHRVPDVLLWDTADPYHYVRLVTAEGSDHLIVGGEDHKTGQARDGAARFARLERWARERFPDLGPVDRRWAGQVLEPADGLAFIGRDPFGDPNVYVGTGFSGNGITYGTLGGQLVCDLVCARANPWQSLYDPARIRLGSLGRLVRENLNVAARYADWLRPGEVADESAITPGTGAVVRHGLDRLAVYRDVDGSVHRNHAACPHLGCAVAWNDVERTWDCPCHGSRFAPTGRVIVGPANRDLRPYAARKPAHAARRDDGREEAADGQQEQV